MKAEADDITLHVMYMQRSDERAFSERDTFDFGQIDRVSPEECGQQVTAPKMDKLLTVNH